MFPRDASGRRWLTARNDEGCILCRGWRWGAARGAAVGRSVAVAGPRKRVGIALCALHIHFSAPAYHSTTTPAPNQLGIAKLSIPEAVLVKSARLRHPHARA
jgi:hypothetical protein